MAKLGTILQTVPAEIFTSSSTQQAVLGAYAETPDGRGFRYVQNGDVAMVPGNVYQSSAEATNHQALVIHPAVIGDTSVLVALGATAALVDEYKDGFVIVTANGSEGRKYGIIGHSAAAASATLTATLSEPIKATITANSTVDLVRNPYRSVVVAPTTETGAVAGVALHNITASEYGWLQTHGPAATLAETAVGVGLRVMRSTSTAGSVGLGSGITADAELQTIGYALTGIAASEFGAVYLQID